MESFKLNTDLISRLGGRITYLGTRNDVLSQNLANLETSNYQAKDLSFSGYLDDLQAQSKIDSNGMAKEAFFKTPKTENVVSTADPGPNGNNVNMEDEMAKLADNSVEFMIATDIIKKNLAHIKLVTSQG